MQVKVYNDNVHPYTEKFRGNTIVIPAGEFIDMDEDEAQYFCSAFTAPKKDEQERPDPLYFKKLRIVAPKKEHKEDPLICHANGERVANAEELNKVLGKFSHMLHKDDEKQEKKSAKENKELKDRITRLEDFIREKLGPSEEEKTDEESVRAT